MPSSIPTISVSSKFYQWATVINQLIAGVVIDSNGAISGTLKWATNGEAIAKTDAAKVITPSNLAALDASATFKGFVELATNAESLTGTDTSRATTPANVKYVLDNRPATEVGTGLIELATTGEVVTGTDTSRASTPAGVKAALDARNATTSVTGLIELATTLEATTGTDTTRALTPATSAMQIAAAITARVATDSAAGIVELATPAEVLAGTDTTRAATAEGVKAALDAKVAVIQTKTGNHTLATTDNGSQLDFTVTANLTLLDPAVAGNGYTFWVRNASQPLTKYGNLGGVGDRQSIITASTNITFDSGTVSNLIDGGFTSNSTDAVDLPGTGSTGITDGSYMRFDFGVGKKYIDEVKIYSSLTPNMGSWIIEGSDNASAWTPLATFTWNTSQQLVPLSGGVVAGYRYYQMRKNGAGSNWTNLWLQEIEFKCAPAGGAGDVVLVGTVDGIVDRKLRRNDCAMIRSNGTAWQTVSGKYSFQAPPVFHALNTVYTVAHGIGEMPHKVWLIVRCIRPEYGWVFGDEINFEGYSLGSSYGGSIAKTTTELIFNTQQTYGNLVVNKITGNSGSNGYITPANWEYIISAEVVK